ncbi:ScyD/ScyE family protein [Pseudokineococcus lusitanus]|uniref:ScyD/ScyE family protein n=1 Tax=Pseudokineococcus lusitanus TaxID=763993 RepID=A0A3N1HRK9_9ACTN|nr:ScyD/ScyE family protein [Pseudokineococcus lusitanus]ROP45002.1 hypothetical protein EDC03_1132 [Pseudokineococcus lusitanus]
MDHSTPAHCCATDPTAGPTGSRTPRPRRRRAVAAGALLATALAGTPAAATAADAPEVHVVAEGLVGPLSLDVQGNGDVVVAQSFAGLLTRVGADGTRADLVTLPGAEVAGVSGASKGGAVYTHSEGQGPDAVARVERVDRRGRVTVLADLAAHERETNPDGATTYGFRDLAASCLDQLPEEFPGRYTGEVYSHPYATAARSGDRTVVADAGGNALLQVGPTGRARTLAVLPAQPATVTADLAAGNGLPDCVVGSQYWFEPVPTDVEVGPDGSLYVSLLPGGPEDPSLGARGSVVRVDGSGRTTTVLTGLLGATGVAVDGRGRVYATELFGGRVVRAVPGSTTGETVVDLPLPAAVEASRGDLWVSTDVLSETGGAQVVRVDL